MKKLKFLFLALVPALVLMITACADDDSSSSGGGVTTVPITDLTLSYPSNTLEVPNVLNPTLTYEPTNTTQTGVIYTIDNDSFASINPATGRVTALSDGIVKITVTSTVDSTITAEYSITITPRIIDTRCANISGLGYDDVSGVWEIYNTNGLVALRSNLSQDAKLVCDIALTNKADNISWTPIGSDANSYFGTFDGDNYTISGLFIDNNTLDYQGLFGIISSNSVIKNLTLSNASITGDVNIGSLVGYSSGRIENIIVIDSTITGVDIIGGVAGELSSDAIIKNVSVIGNTSSVTGNKWTGGIAGRSEGTIINAYNEANVIVDRIADSTAGGITGGSESGTGAIIASHNAGDVTGVGDIGSNGIDIRLGGIVGRNGSLVIASYNTGDISVTGDISYVGGIAGRNSDLNKVIASYSTGLIGAVGNNNYLGGVVGNNGISVQGAAVGILNSNYYITGTATNGIGNPASDDNATSVANIAGLNSQAVLDAMNSAIRTYNNTATFAVGYEFVSGGNNPPILNEVEIPLREIVLSANDQYLQQNDTELLSVQYLPTNAIGIDSAVIDWTNSNSGVASVTNGNLTAIANGDTTITARISGTNFESSINIKVEDLGVTINGTTYEISNVSGLQAFSDALATDNVTGVLVDNITFLPQIDTRVSNWIPITDFSNTFDGDNHTISGVVVYALSSFQGFFSNVSGTIKNLTLDNISVTGDEEIGAVVGFLSTTGIIENVSVIGNTSSVNGGRWTGGIAGFSEGTIINAYNEASISASGSSIAVGGITGGSNIDTGIIVASHNTGDITATGTTRVGGIVGRNSSLVIASYNTGDISVTGDNSFVGGVVGREPGNSVIASYNTGIATATGNNNFVGGVVGNNDSRGTVTSTYYIAGTAANGIGEPASDINAISVANIAALNVEVDNMNNAILDWSTNSGIEYGYRFMQGNPSTTAIPTLFQP